MKKIRDTKGTLHAKMGTIKDKNGMGLTEVEGTKKRWQEYTEELNRNVLTTRQPWWYSHSPRARHSGVWSQVGLRKHYFSSLFYSWESASFTPVDLEILNFKYKRQQASQV